MQRFLFLFVSVFSTLIPSFAIEMDSADIQRQLVDMKPGATLTLPAGVIRGSLTVPAGVSLRGAGYQSTIIDAVGEPEGILVAPLQRKPITTGTTISDLTIRDAQSADLAITSADKVNVRRVLLTGSILGVRLTDARDCRLENVVSARNRYGIVITGGQRNIVVNCTMADNASLGLSIASGIGHIAFNNLIANSATAVLLGDKLEKISLDHNLYYALYIGKMSGQVSRSTLSDWQYLTGSDKRSVKFPIIFADAKSDNYRPINALDWSQERCVAEDWGVSTLAGVMSPTTDISGQKRDAAPDLGAWETNCLPTRLADGNIKVNDGNGLTSAGIFTAQGRLVGYLFHNLPLVKGSYNFWAPLRDFEGSTIPAGKYEIRLLEQQTRWEYLGGVGDNGEVSPANRTAPVWPDWIAFDSWGTLFVGHGWSEDHTNLRAYYADTGELRWTLPGSSDLFGLTMGGDNALYLLVRQNQKQTRLTRLHPSTGKVIPFGLPVRPVFSRDDKQSGTMMAKAGEGQRIIDLFGMLAATRTKLFLLTADGTLYWSDLREPNFVKADFALAGLKTIAGDRCTDLLWVVTKEMHLQSYNMAGKLLSDVVVLPDITALAANNGRVAAACSTTGKVIIFDANNQGVLKEMHSIGRGDGFYGAIANDRFAFQDAGYFRKATLGLDDRGGIAITDYNRAIRFDEKGQHLWHTFGIFGGSLVSIC